MADMLEGSIENQALAQLYELKFAIRDKVPN
jgi:hypothetical protein